MTSTLQYKFLWNKEIQKSIRDWHGLLQEQRGHGNRAALRRCTTPEEILLLSPFYEFYSLVIPYLDKTKLKDNADKPIAIAAMAGLLAYIKKDDPNHSFAAQLHGVGQEKAQPVVSELRFSQLQKSHNWDELYHRLRRSIPLLGGQANIISLADSILHWAYDLDEKTNYLNSKPAERLMVRWAMDYFNPNSFKKNITI